MSYAELNTRSNMLARQLVDRGAGPERFVALALPRSLDMVVAIVGVLKAGAAYLPLDPDLPAERIRHMLEDADPVLLVTTSEIAGGLWGLNTEVPLLVMELLVVDSGQPVGDLTDVERRARLSPDNSAYAIYTSGSTGAPKGVMVSHHNVMRLFSATRDWFGFDEHDVWTLFHSYAFDFSVWEIWGALLHGGRLVVVPFEVSHSPEELLRLLVAEQVTVLNQTPSAFYPLLRADGEDPDLGAQTSLRYVIFGGEALDLWRLSPWYERHGDTAPLLVNMYGITETTVHVTYRQLSQEEIESERGSIVGKPIPDLRIYLLDRRGEPVPIGVAGEIYVGGAGVARGYLNRPELTAERFLTDRFSAEPNARMYRSGDLGRWRADGTIEYLGRNDDQVKIRGFRIELGEIEAQLVRHPQVKEVVVIAREDGPGEKCLVAYAIPREMASPPQAESLREHLKATLPEYMLPSAFVTLESFPLTSNGKLDRRALPAPELSSYVTRGYEPPEGEIEEILAAIWRNLLRIERIGRHDNFFELGGNSLIATRIVAHASHRFDIAMSMRAIFDKPTLMEMAGFIFTEISTESKEAS
jgi:amino acid adenylation domain-containing protein